MNARFYVPYLNRFVSPDTIVPDPKNPQSYNRYSYVVNNPVNLTDPSGHVPESYLANTFLFRDSYLEGLNSLAADFGFASYKNQQAIEQDILDATVIIVVEYTVTDVNGNTKTFRSESLGTVTAQDTVITHNHFGFASQPPGATVTNVSFEILDSNQNQLGTFAFGAGVTFTGQGETGTLTFSSPLKNVTPISQQAGKGNISVGDQVAVAVRERDANGNAIGGVKVIWAEVLAVDGNIINYDYEVYGGDSGGGIFANGIHTANTLSQKTTTRPKRCIWFICWGGGTEITADGALNP